MLYRITKRANAEIEAICDYIARENADAADRMDEKLHEAIRYLSAMREIGHTRSDVKNSNYRFWVVGTYVIAYRLEKSVLIVSRVLHRARDFRRIFGPR
jgi:plasmid stabilization system protein ParE